jgi:two-component system LytT family response regulator
MRKISTIIVDDETKLREVLALKLAEFCPEIEVVGQTNNAVDAYEMCMKLKPDLVFLDVNMPTESGFDFLAKFKNVPFEIIFSTGYQSFALNAFKVNASGYLLKPILTEELINAVQHVTDRIVAKNLVNDQILHRPTNQKSKDNRLFIHKDDGIEIVQIENIIYLEAWEQYTHIFTLDGKKHLLNQNIGKNKEKLEAFNIVFCHKSFMVNTNHIFKISKDDEIIMTNGSKVPLARRRRHEFLELLIKNE